MIRQCLRMEALNAMQSGKYDDQTTIRMIYKEINFPIFRNIFVPECGMIYLRGPFEDCYKHITCDYKCLPAVESRFWKDHNPEYLTVNMITKKQANRLYHTCCKEAKYLTLHFDHQCKLSSILDSLELLYIEGKVIKLVNVIKDCDAPTEGFIYE